MGQDLGSKFIKLLASIAEERKGGKPPSNKTFRKWGAKLEEMIEIGDVADTASKSEGKGIEGTDYIQKIVREKTEEGWRSKYKNKIPRWTSKITFIK